ncbi:MULTISPECIES: response regulator transcription factor [Helicobacter]|uniref:Response regulator transcription factor n=1 Tax=Helicobacter japonicus TaxID=425400 RepID=A0A4U8TV20_9HELI|nr:MULTISPECIES: response regulator transcription factor [Helicobacter]TLE02918.1 response regulator transcription factor [Helicobacter japonicus]
MAAKILLLEDDTLLSEMLFDCLKSMGYEVSLCVNAEEALECAYEKNFDLWILDVKVPLGNGFEVLKTLREAGKNTPAVFLTSLACLEDLKEGYVSGCDDYIKKPFDIDELLLRVASLLKRRFFHYDDEFLTLDKQKGLQFNLTHKALYRGDEMISLTIKEKELLALLLSHHKNFVSLEQIFDTLWEYNEEPSAIALRVYVKNLRKILGKESIITQKGFGYCYCKDLQ